MPLTLDAKLLHDQLAAGVEVYSAGCAGHSLLFERWLREAPERSAGVRYTGIHLPTVNRFAFTDLHPQTRQRGIFLGRDLRRGWEAGQVDHLPLSYSAAWAWLGETAEFDLALLQVAPPDEHGRCSLGVACDFSAAAWPRARKVFAHVNPRMPRSNGPGIPWSSIDAAVVEDCALLEVAAAKPDRALRSVALRLSERIDDGVTLQLGMGRLQAAVLDALADRRQLRIHAGMVSDGLQPLFDAGALIDADDAVTAGVALGSADFYPWAARHVRFRSVGETHDAQRLHGLHRLHAINSALQVDLLGQVNSETIGGRQVSGSGGLSDFIRGARACQGGRAIIALPACTRRGDSRIVPLLPSGPHSLTRCDSDWVVTEYGVADLRHRDVHARARALIAIAAPAHREALERDWHALARSL
jgi:acyl-CoA hydrolase